MSLFASIDIGSNTIRLLIGSVKGSRIKDVFSARKITRLAKGISQTGILKKENIEASLKVLREFSSIISGYGVKNVNVLATSALREAKNSEEFLKKTLAHAGLNIKIISGQKEAELTLKGILSSLQDQSVNTYSSLFIVDIGGGSTEWILCKNKYPVDMGSIPVGVIKLQENFIKSDPVSKEDLKRLIREISPFLEDLKIRVGRYLNKNTGFIGTAGTFTTIASIDLELQTYSREKVHLHRIPLARLCEMDRRLLALPLAERKNITGLEPERADLIIPGIQFTIKIMNYFRFDELIVSDHGLLEGALLEIAESDEENIQETPKP
ncbi:MAG: Ppx/GppA phosphatase family protein [Nitrospirota bacterium]